MNLEGKIESSGTFTVRDFDSGAFLRLMGAEVEPPIHAGEVRISTLDPIPRPSPWRQPFRWLRWNPLMQRRTTLVIPNCEIRNAGDGSFSFSALPPESSGPFFSFEGEENR